MPAYRSFCPQCRRVMLKVPVAFQVADKFVPRAAG